MLQILVFVLIATSVIWSELHNSEKESSQEEYVIKEVPELTTYILWINLKDKETDTKMLGKALAHSINRRYIVEVILNGEAYRGKVYGISSPAFIEKGYDIKKIRGYDLNLDSARNYFRNSGFDVKKKQLHLKIFSAGEKSVTVEEEFQKQWKEGLDIDCDIEVFPKEELVKQVSSGEEGVYFIPIVSQNQTPQGFLEYFYSEGNSLQRNTSFYLEQGVYKNSMFDKYYEAGFNATTIAEKWDNFLKAEQVLIDEARIIPIYYDASYMIHPSYVKNYPMDPWPYGELKEVYFSK